MIRNSSYAKIAVWVLAILTAASFAVAEEPDQEHKKGKPRTGREEVSPFKVSLETGLGYDSNVYRAPGAPYTDYFPATPVSITPVIHSGFFVPMDLDVDFIRKTGKAVRLIAAFSSRNTLYMESENNNANEYTHMLKAGPEFIIGTLGKKENTLQILPFITNHTETYYDRDSGSDKTTSAGEDIADNYSYTSLGIESKLAFRTLPVNIGFTSEWEQRDYENTGFVSEYDHTYYLLGAEAEIPVMKLVELDLQYDYYVRDYDDRHSRDLNGSLFSSAPLLKYVYNQTGASVRVKAAKNLTVSLDYSRLDREDANYVGYNDYTEDEVGVRAVLHLDRFKVRAKYAWTDRTYPQAFAFDNPGQNRMDYDVKKLLIKAEQDLGKHAEAWLEYAFRDTDSSDRRYDYDKYQVLVGVKLKM